MAKKQILSFVAATLIAASFAGCGSSCRPGTDCSAGGNVTPPIVGSIDVTVSDAYVYEAEVTKGGVMFDTMNGAVYTWNNTEEAEFQTIGGANDTNGNGMADAQDPIAPMMKAKAGSSNINPFTTLEVNGMTLEQINNRYGIVLATTDIDVTKADLTTYKASAKAALELAYTQTDGGQITPPNPDGDATDCLPGEDCTDGDNTDGNNTDDGNTDGGTGLPNCDEVEGCISNPVQITPCRPDECIICDSGIVVCADCNDTETPSTTNPDQTTPARPANALRVDCLPGQDCTEEVDVATTTEVTTTSEETDCLPGQDCTTDTPVVDDTIDTTPEVTTSDFPEALLAVFAAIDAAEDMAAVDAIMQTEMGKYLGYFSAAATEPETDNTENNDTSADNGDATDCLPGQDCTEEPATEEPATEEPEVEEPVTNPDQTTPARP